MKKDFDVVVVGAGVTGVALARALRGRSSRLSVCVVEKEPGVAAHASGRNSGVVHAGYNQKPGTEKARFTVEGNAALKAFCRERRVPLRESGILVLAEKGQEGTLETLLEQGRANGVSGLELLPPRKYRELEPLARGVLALFAPTGATVDSPSFVRALAADANERGAEFRFGSGALQVEEAGEGYRVRTPTQTLTAQRLVNCAGAHADRLARRLGAGRGLTVVPFRGEYYDYRGPAVIQRPVYAAPDLRFPFLGIHWTAQPDGSIHVGPNAAFALGRERYAGWRPDWRDLAEMALHPGFWRMWLNPAFLRIARKQAWSSLSRQSFLRAAARLVELPLSAEFLPGRAGIRAQLVDSRGALVDDLVVEEKGNALHVLNVVSPGFTSALPFAEHLAGRVLG